MPEEKIYVDPMNTTFAKVMEISTWVGLIVMVVFGLLYLAGLSSHVGMSVAVSHWEGPASIFWEEIKGLHTVGYSFLVHLDTMDCLSMLGVAILALAPLFSVIGALFRSKKIYTVLLLILSAEFIFAIIRPLIMAGGGE